MRTTKERRQAILAEFERSGVSAAQFAKLAGLCYSTFTGWGGRQRKPRGGKVARPTPLRLVEAVLDPGAQDVAPASHGLRVQRPGGVQLELTSPAQVPLVTALVQGLQPRAARC